MKSAIITGASKGIGRAIALKLSYEGYNVCINYNSSEKEAFELRDKINLKAGISKDKNRAICFKADVSNPVEVKKMIEFAIGEFKSIELLVNNAGIAQSKLFVDITPEDWKKMFDVNVFGTYCASNAVLPHMISNKKGKIINISSIWGISGASMEVHYSASKAAMHGFTKALAKELGPSNIQVNAVAPGVINTDMNSDLSFDDINTIIKQTPLERIGNATDVANTVAFLASEASDFITGEIINISGGFVI